MADGVVGKDIGAGGLGFDSWASEIGRNIDNGLPPVRRFLEAASRQ